MADSLLKNAVVAFFNLAKRWAKPIAARKTAACVAVLASHPSDVHSLLSFSTGC